MGAEKEHTIQFNDPIQEAWQTYKAQERQLLQDHRGEYAWIVGGAVEAVERDRVDLCRLVLERGQSQKGIVVKIEEPVPPREEIFSFDLD